MIDYLEVDGLRVGVYMVRSYIERIAELEANQAQLKHDAIMEAAIDLCDPDGLPMLVGYDDLKNYAKSINQEGE